MKSLGHYITNIHFTILITIKSNSCIMFLLLTFKTMQLESNSLFVQILMRRTVQYEIQKEFIVDYTNPLYFFSHSVSVKLGLAQGTDNTVSCPGPSNAWECLWSL